MRFSTSYNVKNGVRFQLGGNCDEVCYYCLFLDFIEW